MTNVNQQCVPLNWFFDKLTYNGTVVQGFLEKFCLSNVDHHLAEITRGQRELSPKSDFYLQIGTCGLMYENGLMACRVCRFTIRSTNVFWWELLWPLKTLRLLVANLANTQYTKTSKMTENQAHGYSYENAQGELSNEYQHDRVWMVFKNLCVLVLWTKVALALEGLIIGSRAITYISGAKGVDLNTVKDIALNMEKTKAPLSSWAQSCLEVSRRYLTVVSHQDI